MRFGDSALLYNSFLALLLILLFYVWAKRRYQRLVLRFIKEQALKKIYPNYKKGPRITLIVLDLLAILLIFVALARPQWGVYWTEKKAAGLDILIALDASKSMLAEDVKPSRFEFSKEEIKSFIKGLDSDRVGLIAFAGGAFLYCPLTMDYSGLFLALDNLNTESIASGGTDIQGAIEEAVRSFQWARAEDKIMILISDGEKTVGDLRRSIDDAKKNGIKIFCIGVGTEKGDIIPYVDEKGKMSALKDPSGNVVRTRLEEKALQEIAEGTGGMYIRASAEQFGLNVIYDKGLSKLKKRADEEMIAKSYKERFQIPLMFGLITLFMGLGIKLVNRDEAM